MANDDKPKKDKDAALAASKKAMEEAADEARKEWDDMVADLDEPTLTKITDWLVKHVKRAGWKRLAKIIAGRD